VTALLTLYADLDAKLHKEFRNFGANIVVTVPATSSGSALPPDALTLIQQAAGPDALLPYQPFVEALSEGAGLSVDDIVPSADEDATGARRYRFFEQIARHVGDLSPPAPAGTGR